MHGGVIQQRLGATIVGTGDVTVVLGNGVGVTQYTWRHVVAGLDGQARVVRYDNVCSPAAPPGGYRADVYASLHAYVDDLVGLLDELDIRDCLYVGHSISGIVGLLAATAAPERVRQLATICSSARFLEDVGFQGGFSRERIDGLLSDMQRDYVAWSEAFSRLALGTQATDTQLREFHATLGAMRPDVALRVFQLVFLGDNRAVLPRVTQPVTVMQTRSDAMIPLSASEFLVQQLPHATLLPIDAHGHVPMLTAPAAVTRAITDILHAWRA